MDDIIVGLDIGTTKVCAVIGELKEDRTINVLGAGSCSYTDGVKKGAIVDIKRTTDNRYVLIECNPSAMFLGVDYRTGDNIAEIANLFRPSYFQRYANRFNDCLT